MLDPAHIDFVRRFLVMLGAAAAVWFVCVFVFFYFQARAHEKARQRWQR